MSDSDSDSDNQDLCGECQTYQYAPGFGRCHICGTKTCEFCHCVCDRCGDLACDQHYGNCENVDGCIGNSTCDTCMFNCATCNKEICKDCRDHNPSCYECVVARYNRTVLMESKALVLGKKLQRNKMVDCAITTL